MKPSEVIKEVEGYYSINDLLTNKRQDDPYREARAFAYIILFDFVGMSKSSIAVMFGKQHATILSAIRHFKGWFETDYPLFSRYLEVLSKFDEQAVSNSVKITHKVKMGNGIKEFGFTHPSGVYYSKDGELKKLIML